tara:strand:- start:11204 stop:11611 length:408 start_codon:yes stop_codon:yes gene_type:complete
MKRTSTYKSKFKENDWYNQLMKDDIWYNVNCAPDSYVEEMKGSTNPFVRFSPKQCIVCGLRFDGNGSNEVELPGWFNKMPLKIHLCRKHKPEYKKWYRENKSLMSSLFNVRKIGIEHEDSIAYWYKKEKSNESRK